MQYLDLIIRDDRDGEKEIDILYNGYNIIQEIICDDELASTILKLINENRQSDPSETL